MPQSPSLEPLPPAEAIFHEAPTGRPRLPSDASVDEEMLPGDLETLQLRVRRAEAACINERENAAQFEVYALKMQEEKQTLFKYYEAKCNRVKEQANQLKEGKAKAEMLTEMMMGKVSGRAPK